jgi:two-component system, LytTR family, response regulator
MEHEIKAIIIEDMAEYAGTIELLLAEVAPWVNVAGIALSLAEAEKLIVDKNPDAVFLDIQFESEGKTGFDLLDTLKNRNLLNFQLIIITAHIEKKYYARAFEYKALHYIEKPVSKGRLQDAVTRVKETMVNLKLNELASKIGNEIGSLIKENQSPRINIAGLKYNEIVEINDIVWIEADGRMAIIYLKNEKRIVSIENIGKVEDQLKPFSDFFRINRSEIINIRFVEKYSKKEKLVVIPGKIPNHYVSKQKFPEFVGKLTDHVIS